MNIKKSISSTLIVFACIANLFSQKEVQDSSAALVKIETIAADTVRGTIADSTLMKIHTSKKAALLSAIIPGGGQVYNKKYWKIPLIYGAGIGLAYVFSGNYREYNKYRDSYITRISVEKDSSYVGPDYFENISNSGLQSESERTQKNYELAAVGIVLVYALQIVDATVDAHLKTFDVSDDLSLGIRPAVIGNPYSMARGIAPTLGFRVNLKFK